jgi:hypothetical protein
VSYDTLILVLYGVAFGMLALIAAFLFGPYLRDRYWRRGRRGREGMLR